jgi:hypothetical protein
MENKQNIANSVKLFLVSGALTGTVWMWSLFANKTVQDLNKQKQASANQDTTQPPQVVVPVTVEQTATPVPTSNAPTVIPSPTLRVVNIAGGTVPTNPPPVVVYSAPSISNSSSSSSVSASSNPNPPPVATTGSSTP